MTKYRLVDSHCHMHGGYTGLDDFFRDTQRLMENAGLEKMNVAMTPQWDYEYVSQNPLGILFKALHPGKVYSYAGFDYYMPNGICVKSPLDQLNQYMKIGYDGIKMVELKPTVQRRLNHVRISSPYYSEMFSCMEENSIPLLLHVADPETFWFRNQCPQFALDKGWLYEKGDYASKESLYEDTLAMIDAHPKLQISMAHFYFLSDYPDKAIEIMEKYPNVRFDLTPGTEMYGNFSKCPEIWHDFFEKYADRILLGTDNGGLSADGMMPMKDKIEYAVSNVTAITRFLETSDVFTGHGMQLHGIGLSPTTLQKIYALNYEKMAGCTPKPVNISLALQYINELIAVYSNADLPCHDISYPLIREIRQHMAALLK